MTNADQTHVPANGVSRPSVSTPPQRIPISEVQALRVEAANAKVEHAQAEIRHAETMLAHAKSLLNTNQLKLQKVLKEIEDEVCPGDQTIVGVLTDEMVVMAVEKPKQHEPKKRQK